MLFCVQIYVAEIASFGVYALGFGNLKMNEKMALYAVFDIVVGKIYFRFKKSYFSYAR